MEFLLSGIMIIHQLRPEILIFFVGKSCYKKYCSFCQMETRKPLQLFLYWNSVNHLDGLKPSSSCMVILQLRPTKFNSLILIVYYIYTPNFSKRLFSSLFFKKSGEFHDNKNYRVYVKKPHHHLIYISSKFLKHYFL